MPTMPTVPIDWASVNWLYFGVLTVVGFTLALFRRANGGRFFLDLNRHAAVFQAGFLRRSAVGPIICGSPCVLDLLPARLAAADYGHRTGHATHHSRAGASGRSSRPKRHGEARRPRYGSISAAFFALRKLPIGRAVGSLLSH